MAVLLLLLVIFYQPIIFSVTQFVAHRLAGAAKLNLTYHAQGSLFSDLTLNDVAVSPLPENHDFPLEQLEAKQLALRYNLGAALRKDWGHVVQLVRVKDATVVIRPTPPTPKKKSSGPLKFPPALPEVIDIDRVNVTVRQPSGALQVGNLFVHLNQGKPGDLGWQNLEVPGIGQWENVRAGLTARDGVVELTDLKLPPLAEVERLKLDLSKSADGEFGADVNGRVLDAPLELHGLVQQENPAEPSNVSLRLGRVDLAKLEPLIKVPLSGTVNGVEAQLRGDINHPNTWDGLFRVRAEQVRFQTYEAQAAAVETEFHAGVGEINRVEVRSGPNAVNLSGNYRLPADSDRFLEGLEVNVGLALGVPRPELYVPVVQGSLLGSGSFGLAAGHWRGEVGVRTQNLSAKGLQVPGTGAEVLAAGILPFDRDLWSSLQAVVAADVQDASFSPVRVPGVHATVMLPGAAVARVQGLVQAGQSRIDLNARVPLPAGGAALDPKQIDATVNVNVPSAADFLDRPLYDGGLALQGRIGLADLKPTGSLQLSGDQLSYQGAVVRLIRATVQLQGDQVLIGPARLALDEANHVEFNGKAGLATPYPYQAFGQIQLPELAGFNALLRAFHQPEGVSGSLQGTFSGKGDANDLGAQLQLSGDRVAYRGLIVQTLQTAARLEHNHLQLDGCHLSFSPENHVDATAEADLTGPRPFSANVTAALKNVAVFDPFLKQMGQTAGLAGSIDTVVTAKGQVADPLASTAEATVTGSNLRYRGLTLATLNVATGLGERKLTLSTLRLVFDAKNRIEAHGDTQIQEPYTYHAAANVALEDIGFLNELVKSFGQDLNPGGKLTATLTGNGELKNSAGNIEVHGENLRVKPVEGIKVDVAGAYQGESLELSRVQVSSPYADLDTALRFSPQWLELPHLSITKSGNAITGEVKVPLNLSPGAKLPVDLDRPLQVNVRTDKISLASLQPQKPQVTGEVAFQVQASKTLRDPLMQVQVSVRDVRSPAVSALSAASSDLAIRLADKVFTLSGKVQQADIQPLELQGKVPVDVGQIVETGRLPDDTPLQASLKWPSTNLAFIQKVVPLFRIVEGRVGADVNVGGTLKKPLVQGAITANVPRLQAKTDVVPPISNFAARIEFLQDHIRIAQLNGLAGGGAFRVGGGIDLANGTNPTFDIAVNGNQVLLTRSDSVIVRANFDLAIRGPLSAGEVSGKVGIINSRFFQDIDILPLNLPGRPAPKPPSVPPPSQVSVTTPPLRDWKFNIAVRTVQPFLVQSNLARGQVTIDLQIGGTGLAPSVTGYVRVDQLTASLPFSHLDITNGYITFAPGGNPLDPSLNIICTSLIRDYEVHVRIYGNVSNFQILFDSTPALAQGDIATLLATGATTSEFVQNPSLLAGRASFILAQQLLTKVFKIKPDAQQQSFLERLQVDIIPGSKPGSQDVSARFSLTKNYQIIGEFGQEGDVSARLRYLIRFR
ncbi:MAG TPA: translocation/assembly module TamB domain-containing protein [Chthoniobacterales bacterium]